VVLDPLIAANVAAKYWAMARSYSRAAFRALQLASADEGYLISTPDETLTG
jgi:hypothetical protein